MGVENLKGLYLSLPPRGQIFSGPGEDGAFGEEVDGGMVYM